VSEGAMLIASPFVLIISTQSNQVQERAAARDRKTRRQAEQRESAEYSEGESSSPSRTSARLSSRPRRSYGSPPKKSKKKVHARPPIEGTRKSARLSDPAGIQKRSEQANGANLVESLSRRAPISTLKRIKNPLPLPRLNNEDEEDEAKIYARAPLPGRDSKRNIIFENKNRHFQPNVTPEEMLRGGIFGGTAFRPYYSRVLGQQLSSQQDLEEFPASWYSGLDRDKMLMSQEYDPEVNRFGFRAGQTLEDWEAAGWIRMQDPRGWWQVSRLLAFKIDFS
jgi:hypothetical protein